MMPTELFQTFRARYLERLEAAQRELVTVQTELEQAEIAVREAKAQRIALEAFAAGALREKSDAMAGPLHGDLAERYDALMRDPEAARGAARARIKVLEGDVAMLRLAIGQCDRALAAGKVTEFPVRAIVSRPKPAPIDFDNIAIPSQGGR